MTSKILSAAGCALAGIENQFLNAPVEDFGDEQHVLGRTRDLVNPAELLELLAGLAEHAEHLAVQAKLVDTARMGIRAVEDLLPVLARRSDAQCPRRARTEGAALRRTLRKVGLVADRGPGILIVRHIDLDDILEIALAIEHLNAAIAAIGDINLAGGVGGDGMHCIELPGCVTRTAPLLDPVAVLIDFSDARIDV